MTRPVALATCAETHAEADEAPLEDAFARAGVAYEWAVWDDAGVDWSRFAAVLIRTTWDYTDKIDAFRTWIDDVASVTRLWNPAPFVAWNSHKGYLVELGARGVDVVPTTVVPVGTEPGPASVPAGEPGDLIVKPAESAGSIGLTVWPAAGTNPTGALAAVAELHRAGQDAVVQPLLPQIREGETSVMIIDGEVTHAVRKVPAHGDIRSQPEWGADVARVEPTDAQVALGLAAIEATAVIVGRPADSLLYARVDCVDREDRPRLIELELIEPDLYVGYDEHAADLLVAALGRRVGA